MKRTFYLFTSGALYRCDNTICFEPLSGPKRYLPVEDTAEIVVFGELDLNKRFLEFCSRNEILLHFFSHEGYYQGSYYPREHLASGALLLVQAEHYLDEKKRLTLARSFVEGASRNILRVMKYYQARGKDLSASIDSIESLQTSIPHADGIAPLMAFEGNIREMYYKGFDTIVGLPDFVFEGRSRRPPRNELNALISFGNSILYSICLSEIYRTHLDPRIGYLHATNLRRFTLNLDVAEIFKPLIVDRVIFTLLGRGMLKVGDFERGTGGIMMKESARKTFVQQMEEKLHTTIDHREIGHPVSYQRLIRLELYKLEKHLLGDKVYEPFLATW
ncbi:MAG: type I-B CRISPR-associated endonuclease Cas1b [bacterium]